MLLHDPWLLLTLAAVPLWWWLRSRQGRLPALRFPSTGVLSGMPLGGRRHWMWLPPALRAAALALLALGLARPQLGRTEGEYTGQGIDIVLAVDISGSMLAEDFTVAGQRANRLEAVKSVVNEFVGKRVGDRIGLVLFSGRPYTQCPLTLDHGWVRQNLARAEVGMIEDGTAIGSALATAGRRLQLSDAKSKVIILLTDGQSNAGKVTPLTAADAVQALGIKVYTIGAGTKGMAPFPARDFFGNKTYQPVPVDIDEKTLTQIAAKTGGRYFRATDTESLEGIYQEIDQLERTEFKAPEYLDYDELYPWLVVPALLLLLLEQVLSHTWLRRLP